MKSSKQKTAIFVLSFVSLAAVARVGFAVYGTYRSPAAASLSAVSADRMNQLFKPSARVLDLLNRSDAPGPTMDGSFPCVFESVGESDPPPQFGKCGMPTTHSGPVNRFEADLRYGHFVLRQSDLYVKDVFDVPLTRTYNSGDFMHPNRVHAFGKNTNHPFDIAPVGTRFPYTEQWLILEDGDFLDLPRISEGTSFEDAIYQHTETSTEFYKAVTAWNGDGWTTWRTDGFAIAFPEAYKATNTAQGAPTEMRDQDGNRLQLIRDGRRNLMEIRTPHNHWIKFKYDDQSRIVRAQDDKGQWAEYHYDGNGMLADVTLSSGHKQHYSYAGVLMTAIEDESHRVMLRNSYTATTLTGQDFGNGQIYSYSYVPSANGPFAESVDVTSPDGGTTPIALGASVPEFFRKKE
jgi:YD repeat-containing protein